MRQKNRCIVHDSPSIFKEEIGERKFKTAKTREVIALLTKLRSAAMRQPGSISGETLTNYADQQDLCVIATCQTMEEWLKWKENPKRKNVEAMLENFQSGLTAYEEYFLGTPFQN